MRRTSSKPQPKPDAFAHPACSTCSRPILFTQPKDVEHALRAILKDIAPSKLADLSPSQRSSAEHDMLADTRTELAVLVARYGGKCLSCTTDEEILATIEART